MIQFSRFPARVDTSDGRTFKKTGVVVSNGHAQVAEQTGGRVDLVLDRAGVTRVERQINRNTVITFDDGSTWTVSKGQGCSCGSPLKRWFTQVLRAAA